MNESEERMRKTRAEFFAQVSECSDCGELKAEQAEVDYCDQRIVAIEKQRDALKEAVKRTIARQRDLDDCITQMGLDHGTIATLDNQLDNCTNAWERVIAQRDALKVQRDALKAAVLKMHNKKIRSEKVDLSKVRTLFRTWPQVLELVDELEQTRVALADADERAEMTGKRLQRRLEEWHLQYLKRAEAIVDILASHDRV